MTHDWRARWPDAFPRASGPWTVRHHDRWGVLDPELGHAVAVDPAEDRRLPALAEAMVGGRLCGYRAGRRAVVATATSFVKVVRPSRMQALVDRHELLAGGGRPFGVPTVLGTTDDGAVELSVVAGPSLHQDLRMNPRRTVEDVGVLVAALHAETAPAWLPSRPPDEPDVWVATSRRSPTPFLRSIEQVVTELPSLTPRAEVLVHGDLHDKNVFCSHVGPNSSVSTALIDLDGLGVGSPEEDIANLAVHLELRNLQAGSGLTFGWRSRALYRGYETRRPLDPERIEIVERHTWFRLACLYQYRAGSQRLVPDLLRAARAGA